MKLLISFLLVLMASSACYYPRGWHMMDEWDHMPWSYGGVFMWLLLLVLIGVVIYFVARGDKWMKKGGEESSLEILKKRYASGEITREEYNKIKKELE
ncbi:MAG: SHOCT domain-containing protein [candidate division WOR-3 bacterium]|nr:SHOCT domain-containing protein [candidate division WOR-3 bacterium]